MCEVCPMVSAMKSVYDEVHISLYVKIVELLLICFAQQDMVLHDDLVYSCTLAVTCYSQDCGMAWF